MKILSIISLCFILVSCASTVKTAEQPLKYSYLPQKLDIDLLMPPNDENIIDSTLLDYKSVAVDTGQLTTVYGDTLVLPDGVLFSPKKTAEFIYFRTNAKYLDKKLTLTKKMFDEYYDESLKSEKVYQNEIKLLRKKAERSWLEKNIVYFGFVAGIATAVLTEFAVFQTQK
jgi:hypothetical protein